ncbi:hypothetical protein ABGN05_28305 [Aquibium sp. LZ166]|uniref:Uncharacterized protein n=1 Tax=Aquibium pacificus TaxID=3153579 RepID=A0ABV3SVI1_9HYPH
MRVDAAEDEAAPVEEDQDRRSPPIVRSVDPQPEATAIDRSISDLKNRHLRQGTEARQRALARRLDRQGVDRWGTLDLGEARLKCGMKCGRVQPTFSSMRPASRYAQSMMQTDGSKLRVFCQ